MNGELNRITGKYGGRHHVFFRALCRNNNLLGVIIYAVRRNRWIRGVIMNM